MLVFDALNKSLEVRLFVIGNFIFVALLNGVGMIVVKYASAATRVIVSQTKTVIVWVFFLIYPGEGHEKFKVLQ